MVCRLTKNRQCVLQSKIVTSASPGNYSIPSGRNVLYMDFNLPKNICDNYSGLGKMMFDDAFTHYNRSNKIDGIYGEWIKSVDPYKDYGGLSVNLKRFQNSYTSGLSKEQAAFKTITGEWALSKDFSNVDFEVFDLEQGRVEVIFNK